MCSSFSTLAMSQSEIGNMIYGNSWEIKSTRAHLVGLAAVQVYRAFRAHTPNWLCQAKSFARDLKCRLLECVLAVVCAMIVVAFKCLTGKYKSFRGFETKKKKERMPPPLPSPSSSPKASITSTEYFRMCHLLKQTAATAQRTYSILYLYVYVLLFIIGRCSLISTLTYCLICRYMRLACIYPYCIADKNQMPITPKP